MSALASREFPNCLGGAVPRRGFAISPPVARVLLETSCPLANEGAGNAGCPLHPQPRVQCVGSTRVSSPQVTGTPGIPTPDGFTAYFFLSPEIGLSCLRRLQSCIRRLDAGVEASGPHDLTVRISTVRQRRCRV